MNVKQWTALYQILTTLLCLMFRRSGMRFFRNFPEFRNFYDLRGHSRGYPRSGLIFMGGGGGRELVGTISCVYFATQSLSIACIHHSLNQL